MGGVVVRGVAVGPFVIDGVVVRGVAVGPFVIDGVFVGAVVAFCPNAAEDSVRIADKKEIAKPPNAFRAIIVFAANSSDKKGRSCAYR